MQLFDLPIELLGEIVDTVVLAGGLNRALELRRLSRYFANELIASLCRTGVIEECLDRVQWDGTTHRRTRPQDSAWNRFLVPILIRWKIDHDAPGQHRLIDTIRRTTEQLVKRGHERNETYKKLSEAVSFLWGFHSVVRDLDSPNRPSPTLPEDDEYLNTVDLVAAAGIVGDNEIIRQADVILLPVSSTYFGSVLTAVCFRGDLGMVEYLLQYHPLARYISGLSGQLYSPIGQFRQAGLERFRYPLSAAVHGGHLELLRRLCPNKCDDAFRIDIIIVLPIAAASGHLDVMKFLLEHLSSHRKVSIHNLLNDVEEARSNPTRLPMSKVLAQKAVTHGHRDIVEYLMINGAKKVLLKDDPKAGLSLLRIAATQGDKEMVRLLLKSGIPPNLMGVRRTPLGIAMSHGWTDVVEVLIEYRAEASDPIMPSPIVWAAAQGNAELVRMWLRNGAELNGPSSNMAYFVFFMAYKDNINLETIEMLRQNGLKKMNMGQVMDFLKKYPWEWHEMALVLPKVFKIMDSQGIKFIPNSFASYLRKFSKTIIQAQ